MKALKISVLSTLAAALCVSVGATAPVVVDYTPISINLAGTSVKNGAGAAYSINNGSLLAKINLYLGTRGTTLALNNVNGHLVVLDVAKTQVADLTSGVYYTNPVDHVQYWVGTESSLPFVSSIFEVTSGSVALPNFSVGGSARSENWFYLYFEDNYNGWENDYYIQIPSGNIATYALSLKNGAYKQSFSATVHGDFWDYINGNSGTVSGIISASGTSAVPAPAYWDPFTPYIIN